MYDFLKNQTTNFIEYAHDIQYLIGSLNANSVIKDNQREDINVYKDRIEKINLISILISAKSTFFRYLTEDLNIVKRDAVNITGKTFKISKGIPFLAASTKKNVTTVFNSNSKSNILMVDIFEFIPYIIAENAIKYGPKDMEIEFDVHETQNFIVVSIASLGPMLDDGEELKIFDRGYRGKAVVKAGFTGNGLGLFQASKASKELFNGSIQVRQDKKRAFSINNIDYANTVFSIKIPK